MFAKMHGKMLYLEYYKYSLSFVDQDFFILITNYRNPDNSGITYNDWIMENKTLKYITIN